ADQPRGIRDDGGPGGLPGLDGGHQCLRDERIHHLSRDPSALQRRALLPRPPALTSAQELASVSPAAPASSGSRSRRSASRAAWLSASFLLLPRPRPNSSPWWKTAHSKRRSWSGPVTHVSSYWGASGDRDWSNS